MKLTMSKASVCVALLLAHLTYAADETPEAVAEQYMAATKKGDFAACASLMHSRALDDLKKLMLPVLDAAQQADDKSLLRLFDGATDYKSVSELSAKDFFVKFMTGVSKINPAMLATLKDSQMEVIGHVLEKEKTAHVVFRMKVNMDDISVTKTEVVSLEKDNGAWRALLTGNVEGMAQMLQRRFKAGKK
ncbi:MAG TPA: hypothetical protein VEJ63_19855 [Planctomycetota bacterium]|nr:hypothetical protein [Planctomycetota bacterium]